MNRVLNAIGKLETHLAQKKMNTEDVEKHRKSLDMPFKDFCEFQNLKSLAYCDGVLNMEEAQTVYSFLGEVPEHFNRQSFSIKYVLTKILGELVEKQIQKKMMR